ncbi:3-carboxyethylcatechol 2,3-dioxygenase [Cryptosporangium aurantiacum]|uniref:2,3-dihydroxyphenylpropionate 1,2-dioxygenase n=1 Tax=Cryptosporangium aurantiacum TaxID=134849 RepID=A0A1M7PMP5_9ACTN|nr:3-carboxyethylcatechol 2,3-dioxygenase [Cryptosporangium aurantiacum]SHN18511.1 2,3-dihydroxyphenylpropionate 1,2-dioxygenase [Cryptosporangium aurantiacum]
MAEQRRLVVCASHSPGMERDTERVEGTEFRAGLARARDLVTEFDPELVVLFGGDHRRAFRTVVPSFAVSLSAGIIAEGNHGPAALDVPYGTARNLTEHLLTAGIDIAVCRDVDLDHAFAQPLRDLLGAVDARPVIPVAVNCATAPLPRAGRVLALGRAVANFLDDVGARVLVIGTGGLSHSPPSLEVDAYELDDDERARLIAEGSEAARTKIRPDWDRAFLTAMASWDTDRLTELTDHAHQDAGAGANEVRTWLAAGAAGGGRSLRQLVYQPVPEWITGMAAVASA